MTGEGFHATGKERLREQVDVRQADQQSAGFDALDPLPLGTLGKLICKGLQCKQSPISTNDEHLPVEVLHTDQGRDVLHLGLATEQLVGQSLHRLAFAPAVPESH